jgi:thiol-disulfide isomerase/thioredoxin
MTASDVLSVEPPAFDAALADGDPRLLVAYFWGPDCPNCEVFARELPSLLPSLDGTKVRLLKVNAYEHMELARRYSLFGIPTFLLFRGGKLLGKMSQYRGRDFWLDVIHEQEAPSAPA